MIAGADPVRVAAVTNGVPRAPPSPPTCPKGSAMSAPTTSQPTSTPPSTAPPSRGCGRPLLLRLHFYIGVFIGPFLLVAAVSGAFYALSPQLERVIYAEALTGTVTEQPLSLNAQVAAAQAVTGLEAAPVVVRPAEDGGTTRVMFTDPALGISEHRGGCSWTRAPGRWSVT